jgi:prepilin-type N-terminal cleavage/methylation domain-containing protein/prepilin-type processing-associated H-X9-DG protein
MRPSSPTRPARAFTLIELLVVIAIIAVLIGILLPALGTARRSAAGLVCTASVRSVGQALHLYADDSRDALPLSDHVGGFGNPDPIGTRLATWTVALLPYLGAEGFTRDDLASPARLARLDAPWRSSVESLYRCGLDPRAGDPPASGAGVYDGSYGMNVYFVLTPSELDPLGAGSGRTWRRRDLVPRPTATVAFGEVDEGDRADAMVDHFMAHFWTQFGAPTDRVAKTRHGSDASYLMLDGHARGLRFESTFDPERGVDGWNPATAGSGASR